MKNLKKIILIGFLSTLATMMIACSGDEGKNEEKKEASGDHVWKTQTDTLKTAKDMAKKMQESLKQQQEKMDENE